jgi:hypothetical protein
MTKTALIAATALLALAPMTRDNPAAGEDRRAHPPTGPQSRFAAFTPSTYSAEARTVELVLSTGAAVDRHYFVEELEISATAVDIGRVAQGVVPLLDSHNRWGINANLGTIVAVRFETIGGVAALTATARFADTPAGREAEGMVARGELRGVSIGYAPQGLGRRGDRCRNRKTHLARDFLGAPGRQPGHRSRRSRRRGALGGPFPRTFRFHRRWRHPSRGRRYETLPFAGRHGRRSGPVGCPCGLRHQWPRPGRCHGQPGG